MATDINALLEAERLRLAQEIAAQQALATKTQVNPKTGKEEPADDSYGARTRLDKLNDDYRALISLMRPSSSAATTVGEIKEVPPDSGNYVRIQPDNTAVPITGLPPSSPKPQTLDQQTVTVGSTIYAIDPNNPTGPLLARTPTAADEQDKANKVAQRVQNLQLNGHYATDDEILDFNTKLQKSGIDKQAAARAQAEFEADQRRKDAAEKRAQELQAGTVAQQGATLGATQASTAATQASTAATAGAEGRAAARFPLDIEQATATRAGTEASTAATQQSTATSKQAMQIAGAPQVQTAPTGMSQWQRDPFSGKLSTTDMNPEWQAKTQTDVAARVGQIQSLANAKKAEVLSKVKPDGSYTNDMALQEFNSWYDKNVQPQLGALSAAQQSAQIEQAKAIQENRRNALSTAQNSGTLAVNAFNAQKDIRPMTSKTADVMAQIRSGKPMSGIDTSGAFTYNGPLPTDMAQDAVQNALKYIDSNAAAATGAPQPNLSGIDINEAIGRNQYFPGGVQAAGGMPDWLSGGAPPPAPLSPTAPAPTPVPAMAGAGFKTGWPGSDPRLTGIYDPSYYDPGTYTRIP